MAPATPPHTTTTEPDLTRHACDGPPRGNHGLVGLWHGDKNPHTKASGMAPATPPHTTTTEPDLTRRTPQEATADEPKSGPSHP